MGIVRLGPGGEVEVIETCSEEAAARAEAAVISKAEALGRMAARRDFQHDVGDAEKGA